MRVIIRIIDSWEVVMQPAHNKKVLRKPVNVTADIDLVRRVRDEKGNLSALLEESMVAFLEKKELERWKEENRESFESYNLMVEKHGLLSDEIGLL
jgi:antitoxin CcdA